MFFRFKNVYLISSPIDDEIKILSDFHSFKANTYYDSVSKGSSPIFNVFGLMVNAFVSNGLMAIKTLNLLSLFGIFVTWAYFQIKFKVYNKNLIYLYLPVLFYICVYQRHFYTAYTDGLFTFFISFSLFLILCSVLSNRYKKLLFLSSFVFLAFALGVREILALYSIGFLTIYFYLIWKNEFSGMYFLYGVCLFIIISIFIHYPSLIDKGTLSFHTKAAFEDMSWTQRNFLQILNKSHIMPSWEKVRAYLNINGVSSLPYSDLEALTNYPDIILINWFRQTFLSILPFFRQLGLMFPLAVFVIFFNSNNAKKYSFVPSIFLLFFLIFSFQFAFLPLYRIEFRWFSLFPILFVVSLFYSLDMTFFKNKYYGYLFFTNLIVLSIFNFLLYGLW
ncbi:hypothetical protein [Algoriphagus ratkowskyi]|nr:hypothetical protein [Algoriphagus ratkowskyi]TXD75483.1 hypothetical protein ESW18_20350 [Algoriphagus ratkowskyi]